MSWRRFFRRPYKDQECVQELEAHIAKEIEDNLAQGMNPDEARRAAYLKVGNPVRVREEIWRNNSFMPLEHILRDIRYACRTLSRNPGYALVAILTLGLGIGANTAIFSVVNGVLLRPLPFADAGRIVHLQQKALKISQDPFGFSVQEIRDYREQGTIFSSLAEYHSMTFTMLGTTVPERVGTGVVSANFFDVFGVKPLLGRLLTPADESMTAPPVMVLSYEYWMKEFGGDKHVIGRSFELNDRMHTVVGVLPPLPAYPGTDDLYMPTTSCPFRSGKEMMSNRDSRMMDVYARLQPGVTPQQVADNLQTITRRLQMAYPRSYPQYSGFSAESIPIERELTHAARPTFLMLLAASGFVLLLACANLANFALSRHLGRSREIAVRLATGASRAQVFRQLLTESLLLASAGGILGVLIALSGSRLLVAYASRMTPLAAEVHLDGSVILFAIATSLLAGVIFGVLPSLIASRVRIDSLHDSARTTGSEGNMRTRNVLVAFQVSLSVLLLIGAGLTVRSLYNLLTVDPGFKTQNVLSMAVSLNWTKYQTQASRDSFYRQLLDRAQTMPSVTDAAISMTVPLNGDTGSMQSGSIELEGQPVHPGEPVPQADFRVASSNYFRLLGVPVLSGRPFTDQDTNQSLPVAIVNDLTARHYWPNESRSVTVFQRMKEKRGQRLLE